MRRRGQTLVIFALTLLLLVLMVTMTLSIGMKAKEKMEMQTVADAAAYSNAVATARAFNSISLMNRALMGHMVAMTGVESLISWAGFYRGSLGAAQDAYDMAMIPYSLIALSNCPCAPTNALCARYCTCAMQAISDINDAKNDLQEEDDDLQSDWDDIDKQAGLEARSLQITQLAEDQKALFRTITDGYSSATIAGQIVGVANQGGKVELKESTSSAAVNNREIEGGENCTGNGAACTRRAADHKLHFVYAAMGSRGYPFVTGRNEAFPIRTKIQSIIPRRDLITTLTNEGSGYFPAEGNMTHSAQPIDATEVWGDDHGTLSLTFGRGQTPCPPTSFGTGTPESHVRSNHSGDGSDEHTWTGGGDSDAESHTMGDCQACPGMWPPHMDYNYKNLTAGENLFGQPKTYAVIQRDYAQRMQGGGADPWNLAFRFRFSSSDTEFDNRGIRLVSSGGTDISMATALSAGITYYKRHGGMQGSRWREPPNFLNPFWRATLVSAQIDTQGKADIESTLNSAASFTAEAYKALDDAGYSAW